MTSWPVLNFCGHTVIIVDRMLRRTEDQIAAYRKVARSDPRHVCANCQFADPEAYSATVERVELAEREAQEAERRAMMVGIDEDGS